MTYELTSEILRFRLQECLDAGRQLERALPEIALQAKSVELRRLLLGRVGQIRLRRDIVSDSLILLDRLEDPAVQFDSPDYLPLLSRETGEAPCEQLETLLGEARLVADGITQANTRDAALFSLIQRITAYEADCSCCALDLAFNLGDADITDLLREIAHEERAFVRKLRDFEESATLAAA